MITTMFKNDRLRFILQIMGSCLLMWMFCVAFIGCDLEKTPTGIVFSHKKHLDEGYPCDLCHLLVSFTDPKRPKERVCSFCHEIGDHTKPTKDCAFCHTRTDFTSGGVTRITFSDNKFNHKAHMQAGIRCQACHTGQNKAKDYFDIVIPDMENCTICHLAMGVPNECEICHNIWGDEVIPENHDHLWMREHGKFAEVDFESNCDYCHSNKSFCQDCHMAIKPRSHTLFFKNRGHGFEADMNRLSCEPCHQQDFCVDCHNTDGGVKPASHTAMFGGRRPYLHCFSCHFPDGTANGCNTCHNAIKTMGTHLDAMGNVDPIPLVVALEGSFNCLNGCHPYQSVSPRHPLANMNNAECLLCHNF